MNTSTRHDSRILYNSVCQGYLPRSLPVPLKCIALHAGPSQLSVVSDTSSLVDFDEINHIITRDTPSAPFRSSVIDIYTRTVRDLGSHAAAVKGFPCLRKTVPIAPSFKFAGPIRQLGRKLLNKSLGHCHEGHQCILANDACSDDAEREVQKESRTNFLKLCRSFCDDWLGFIRNRDVVGACNIAFCAWHVLVHGQHPFEA